MSSRAAVSQLKRTWKKLSMAAPVVAPSAYPQARKAKDCSYEICGHKVEDPYQWLEDPDGEETKAFVDKLNAVSGPFLEAAPARQALRGKITAAWNYEKFGSPSRHNSHYLWSHNSGLQNQYVLYSSTTPTGPGTEFLDPNKLADDGTTALGCRAFTKDGTIFAYGVCEKGSDWTSLRLKRFPSGEDLPDRLEKLRYTSVAWLHDNSGLFYSMYPASEAAGKGSATEANKNHSLYFHQLGDDQDKDVLVHDHPDPDMMIGAEVSEDGQLLIVSSDKGCDPYNMLHYAELTKGKNPTGKLELKPIVGEFTAKWDYVTSKGMELILETNSKAPMFKLVKAKPGADGAWVFEDLVAERKAKLQWASPIPGRRMIVSYLEDCKDALYVLDMDTGKELYQLPLDIGTVTSIYAKEDQTEVFYRWESDLNPGRIFRLDFSSEESKTKAPKAELIRQMKVPGFEPEDFVAQQFFYPSKDGTKVPMFVLSLKGAAKDGTNPTILYGYGGFNISLTPSFSLSRLVFVRQLGGVYAIANLRGGSEYGERWHEAGMKERKQTVFDDFVAAGDWLVKEGWTKPSLLVSHGASNGGLLVAATAHQRPDLFQGVINRVGVLDMLRFHKFTIGHAWVPEFGNPEDPAHYPFIRAYSPLHNIPTPAAPAQLPAQLIMSADHDDRVVPLHSLKYVARLYELVAAQMPHQTLPLLARIETKAGHGAGKPTAKVIDELVDIYSFVQRVTGAQWKD